MNELLHATLRFLLWNSVFASVVLLLAWGGIKILGVRSPGIRQAAWALVFLRLVLPVAGTPGIDPGAWWTAATAQFASTSAMGQWLDHALLLSGSGDPAVSSAATETSNVLLAVFFVWLVGALITATCLWHRRRRYVRLVRAGRPVRGELARLAERWIEQYQLGRSVRIVTIDAALSPFTLGVRRPTVALPRFIPEGSAGSALDCVLVHELAHVRRRDDARMLLQLVLTTVYWFHPGVWWCGRRMHEEREKLADRLALDTGAISPRRYADHLLAFIGAGRSITLAHATTGTLLRLEDRMRSIMSRPARRPLHWCALLGACVGLALVAPVTGQSESAAQQELDFRSPVPGRAVRSGFGPVEGRTDRHLGVDIPAPRGTAVLASAGGTVVVAEERGAYGNLVIVEHADGWTTRYAHLDRIGVSAGENLRAGALIGDVGSTGVSTGPHLHFEIWQGEDAQDPAQLIAVFRP